MTRTRPVVLLLVTCAALAAPAVASAAANVDSPPPDIQRTERAVLELHDAKQAVIAKRAANRREADQALKACKRGGPGWARIRKVRDPSQHGAYVRGAKALWADLREAALDGAALQTYKPAFDRFLGRFAPPLTDPVLQAGVESIRARLAYEDAAHSFATCKTFDKVTKPIRQFKPGVTADYLAGNLFLRMDRYVTDQQKAAVRKHWPKAQEQALDAARARLAELGGDVGRATYFRYSYSLNG